MNEVLPITRNYDLVKGVSVGLNVGECVVCRCGDSDTTLCAAALQQDDDIFLQNIVIFESPISRAKQMHPFKGGFSEKKLAKGPIVRAIAKAAGNDRHDLAAWLHKYDGKGNKGRI